MERDAPNSSHGIRVHGLPTDAETRCVHWSGPSDVIAIRFACCERFYPCHACHGAVADHPPVVWAADRHDEEAVLCGVCGAVHSIRAYLEADACPACGVGFNPGCRLHRHLYFA